MKTHAYVALGSDARLELIDQPEPEPRANEVVVDVETVAVNRLDLAVLSGRGPGDGVTLPFVPGIDPSGVIHSIGDEVRGLSKGQRVVAKPNIACFACRECLEGEPWACTRQTIVGVDRPGGFAPLVAIPAVNAIPIPDSLRHAEATAAIHSFPVALRMIKQAGDVTPGMRVVVIGGAGAVGTACIQLCRRSGADVVGLVGGEEKVALVRTLGATAIDHEAESDLVGAIHKATSGRGPDLVLDTAGSGPTASAALAALGWRGAYATCGAHAGGRVDLDLATLYRKRQRVVGSSASGYDDVHQVLSDLDREVIQVQIDSVLPMSEASAAYDALRSRSNLGKIVLQHEKE